MVRAVNTPVLGLSGMARPSRSIRSSPESPSTSRRLALVPAGKVGSAFALARSIFEGLYRGAWILICATEAELERFEREARAAANVVGLTPGVYDVVNNLQVTTK